ncbi:MAG TPA: glycosyltransferase family 39 protein [Candidatus Saccharimonadia bacterium]|nr:glycosyltransferase family 39 protein [Candidatus Saccharimonadia bacterium]
MKTLSFEFPAHRLIQLKQFLGTHVELILKIVLALISIACFVIFSKANLSLAYNDARSHLDIGRRVVEGLKPGMAQLGSVWLPLPHILMIPTIWNDWMWHTGLSGSLQSMASYVITSVIIYRFLKRLGADKASAVFGTALFALNLNILYLQSTAMTELLLIGTMTLSAYELIKWHEDNSIQTLVKTAFWIMLSTLIRYDGWFLLLNAAFLIVVHGLILKRKHPREAITYAEGLFFLVCTLAGFGIFLWLVWNAVIFHDPLYFAFGPYSAHAQQDQLAQAGVLLTKKHVWLSFETYWYAMIYNAGVVPMILGVAGAFVLWFDKRVSPHVRLASTVLLAPFFFNVIALYLGHSVLFIQNINGNTWFNVRYGVMIIPSLSIFAGYLFYRLKLLRPLFIGVVAFTMLVQFINIDAVTIDDGRVGSSQKNVTQVSGWLAQHVQGKPGFVLISAASHDAIIFSSGLPMIRFIHEGTGTYWLNATTEPDQWARWIVMRTNDPNDQTFKLVSKSGQLDKYTLVESYPFADIYQLKDQYVPQLKTEPVLGRQR